MKPKTVIVIDVGRNPHDLVGGTCFFEFPTGSLPSIVLFLRLNIASTGNLWATLSIKTGRNGQLGFERCCQPIFRPVG